jgi:hypothetical protein
MLKKDLDTADIVRDGLLNEAALRQSYRERSGAKLGHHA